MRKASYVYLCSVPVLTILFAFITGHISYKLYLPIWFLNLFNMGFSVRTLSKGIITGDRKEKKYLLAAGSLLIATMALVSVIFGMGAPPDTMQGWLDTATEQKARFDVLLAAGILLALGFSVLKLLLNGRGETLYAQLGFTAIIIAVPLFFINTSFWHSFALKAFAVKIQENSKSLPDWFKASGQQMWIITIGEVLLTYFAIAMFAASLRSAGIFRRIPALIYITIS
ncbi:MAG: hypothetical protein JST39_14465, partial [Bacteroidetes bacterium]|nr:hypothetical protein [Bacteroidota bacterium]